MISEVLSRVELARQGCRDVYYEWEEECAKYFGVPIRKVIIDSRPTSQNDAAAKSLIRFVKDNARKLLPSLYSCLYRIRWAYSSPPLTQDIKANLSICFVMFVSEMSVCEGSNGILIFLDAWDNFHFWDIIRRTKNFKLFYVTSRDVYNRIKAKAPSSNVRYMPLSIADKYHSVNFTAYRDKYIDVVMPGRGNPVLHEYMLKYESEHSNIKYLCKRGNRVYTSRDGSISINADDREGYMNMLAASRVSIVGCSGIDNARPDTNGICFVTPRFYESAIMGCALIGRYPDNEEFTELNMRKYCPNITSYEQFCECLEHALAQTPEELYAQNHDFIINSLTSKRAEQIRHDLEALTCTNS